MITPWNNKNWHIVLNISGDIKHPKINLTEDQLKIHINKDKMQKEINRLSKKVNKFLEDIPIYTAAHN